MPYSSPIPKPSDTVRAAVVHCSDGRYVAHCSDFVHDGLGIDQWDLIALPGGPASLIEHAASQVDGDRVAGELKFLADAHGLQRVVMIAHQGCGLYAAAMDLPDNLLEGQQRTDLAQAAAQIRNTTGIDAVEAWFLRIADGEISFEEVPLV
jgi:hypothetical protein